MGVKGGDCEAGKFGIEFHVGQCVVSCRGK